MKEVFKYAKHVRPGDHLQFAGDEWAPVQKLSVVIDCGQTPFHCVPSDTILLVRTPMVTSNAEIMRRRMDSLEDAMQCMSPLPNGEASEAIARLQRLQDLIESHSGVVQ